MFGHYFMLPIPDIDHTAYWLILGANPVASNGSLMSAPDVAKRLKAIRERGGKVVVIDPCRTETADVATRHHFIRPGTDAAFLLALVNALLELGPPRVERYGDQLAGLDARARGDPALRRRARGGVPRAFPPRTIRTIAREIARRAVRRGLRPHGRFRRSPSAPCASGSSRCVNLLTGNLDAVGGAMPTLPAVPLTGPGTRPGGPGKTRSRVSRTARCSAASSPRPRWPRRSRRPARARCARCSPSRAIPVSSTPNGRRLDRAFEGLEFMASIDIYVNETTRHADVILPPASMLEHDNYDVVFNALAIRNVARFNPPVFEKPAGAKLRLGDLQRARRGVCTCRPAASTSRCPRRPCSSTWACARGRGPRP